VSAVRAERANEKTVRVRRMKRLQVEKLERSLYQMRIIIIRRGSKALLEVQVLSRWLSSG